MDKVVHSIQNQSLKEVMTKKVWATQQSNTEEFDGTVEIREGELLFTPPRGFGKFPMIMAGENVEIYWNGEKVDYPVVVHETDEIEIRPLDTLPRVDFDIELSEDRLTAYLTVTRVKGRKYELIDTRPMNQLKVFAKCVAVNEPESLNLDVILKELQDKGIVYGIQMEEILRAIQCGESQITVEAAKGLHPTESTDATIVYNFDSNNHLGWVKNPYNSRKIHSVSVGEIVAIKRLPQPGEPGIDVMGQPVLPRVPQDTPILIRDGVKLIKDGTVAVATRSGRPVLEGNKKKYISVRPLYIVQGDVDMRVGNIDFNGDIVITGSVLDGFTVKAGGSITVYGDVMHASLYAKGDITISKKAITAQLKAGGSAVSYKRIDKLLDEITVRLESLCEAIETIKKQPAFTTLDLNEKGDGQLIQLLLDYKFKDIPKLINQLVDKIVNESNEGIVSEAIVTASLLSQKLCNLGPMRIQHNNEISQILEEIQKTREVVDGLLLNSANIIVGYVQNSNLQASGDITITGQGMITSRVEAEGRISIPSGVVRGGELIAREGIKVFELGSTRDAEVHVRLLDNCSLEVIKAHPVVLVKYGSQIKIIQDHIRNLKVYPYNRNLIVETA